MPVGVEYSLNNTEVLMINTVLRKRWFRAVYAMLVAALVFVLCMTPAMAAAEQYSITGRFYQTESRATLASINNLRQGSGAWYWNEDNATKTVQTDLGALTYDYNLEQIAMQRAAEIAVFYAHERPDGSAFYTAEFNGTKSCAENIAISTGKMSAEEAFELWREENEPYKGQGHRRNMLDKSLTCVGVAHFEYRGVHTFVQEFGRSNSGASDPGAVNSDKTMTVPVSTSNLKLGVTCRYSGFKIMSGGVSDLPSLNVGVKPEGSYADSMCPGLEVSTSDYTVSWESSNTSIVTVSGSQFVAGNAGEANLIATVTAKDGSKASTSLKIEVLPLDLSNLSLSISDVEYYGEPVDFDISITFNGVKLTRGTDYTLTFENNDRPGMASVTIKGIGNESGAARFEWEKEIPVEDAKALLDLAEPGVIDKTRYLVKNTDGVHTWEVDEFYGDNDGLTVAEVELADENEPFDKPAWLGEEVTGDPRYYNAMLVKNPYKNWK